MRPIYLDHAATTPLEPQARQAMEPWLTCEYGNPSSQHSQGRRARMAIDEARETVASALACLPGEVVFTASGTEAANLAILGSAWANRGGARKRILFGASEHHCVLHTAPLLRDLGFVVELLPVEVDGAVSVETVRVSLAADVFLVSVMHANNETGAINDAAAIGAACREAGALYHCDAVQTFGLLPFKVNELGAHFVAVSAHKMYGPKGIGALYVAGGVELNGYPAGGGQERDLRAGTENVAAIVGFAKAVSIAEQDKCRGQRAANARDAFVKRLSKLLAGATQPHFTRGKAAMLPTHAHLRIPGLSAETALIILDRLGVAASSGAACSSGSIETSHVLRAAGLSEAEAAEGLRFSFGKDSTLQDARKAAEHTAEAAATALASG